MTHPTAPEYDAQARTGTSGHRFARWLTALPLLLITVLLGVVLGGRFGKDPKIVESPLIGSPAPPIDLAYLERAGHWSLTEARGRVVVVNFWASWCLGCRFEHDDLLAAAAAYQDDGVVFVGILFQDEASQAVAFLDELGRGYPSLVDPGSRVAVDFGVWAIPETYFIDRRGVVRAKIQGESTLSALSAQIDVLLAEPPP